MYLEKAIFYNRAPFTDRIELDFAVKGVNVLTSINGKGKTTVLSHITDAFYEMAKRCFPLSFKGKEDKYYRLLSRAFNVETVKYSIVYLRFRHGDVNIDYVDVQDGKGDGKLNADEYNKQVTNLLDGRKIDFENNIKKQLNGRGEIKYFEVFKKESNNIKTLIGNEANDVIRNIFNKELLTFFPSYRYEKPYYLNEPYEPEFQVGDDNFTGMMKNRIEVISDLEEIAKWFLDVVLDWLISKDNKKSEEVDKHIALYNNMNKILGEVLYAKRGDNDNLTLGIAPRNTGKQRVGIAKNGKTFIPSVFHLSSGEASLLCIFEEILRQGDRIRNSIALENIRGIVLIDEVDMHLHIKLQKEILPRLFKMFPNVQFIVSSHSPFLNMGLFGSKDIAHKIFNLDIRQELLDLKKDKQYEEIYKGAMLKYEGLMQSYINFVDIVSNPNATILIVEGETDKKHLEIAKAKLEEARNDGKDEENNIQLQILYAKGSKNLYLMLKYLSKLPLNNKVIGMFDRDEDSILNEIERENYKLLGNNVYAFAIPLVNKDEFKTDKISIEHYYKRRDLTQEDENGRRIFLGGEFDECGNSRDRSYQTKVSGIKNKSEMNGIIDEKVYKMDDLEQKHSIALSKDDFANLIARKAAKKDCDIDFSNFKKIFDVIREIIGGNPSNK